MVRAASSPLAPTAAQLKKTSRSATSQFGSLLLTELGFHETDPKEIEEREKYVLDPVGWVQTKLRDHPWSKQREILESIRDNRRTAVQSCHASGKSHVSARACAWWLSTHEPGEAFVVSCYADDVEVLTRRGWMLFKDVRTGDDGDLFATRNPLTREFEWQRATEFYESPFEGVVVRFDGGARGGTSFGLRVTPNHRMLTRWSLYQDGVLTTGELFKRADAITDRGAALPALSTWSGSSPDKVRFGKYEWSANDFASFMGAWLAEGSLGTRRRRPRSARKSRGAQQGIINITQFPGTKGFEPFKELLTRMLGREPLHDGGKTFVFWNTDLWRFLKSLGTASTKRIPAEMKEWDSGALSLLLYHYWLGDGHESDGNYRITTTSRQMADDIQEIAQKVGLYATISRRPPRLGGAVNGRRIVGKHDTYTICLNRSQVRTVHPHREHYSGNVYCVSVPNQTLYVRCNGKPVWCGNSAPTWKQIRAVLWRELSRAHSRGKLNGRITQQAEWVARMPEGHEEIIAMGLKPQDYDPAAFQGIHARYVLVVFDEAAGIFGQLWHAADSLISNDDSRFLAIGNPDDPASEFADNCKPGSGWNVIRISAFDTPNFTGEEVPDRLKHNLVGPAWVEEKRRKWGETNPLYIAKVLGEFPETSEDGLIPMKWIRQATERTLEAVGPIELGVDVGGGGDKTVIAMNQNGVVRIIKRTQEPDTMTSLSALLEEMKRVDPIIARVDSIGLGAGMVDRAREIARDKDGHRSKLAARIEGVNVGRAPARTDKFVNLRAENYWNLRERFQDGRIDLDPDEEDLIAQLVDIQYRRTGRGLIQIESKDEMKARGKRSPDEADAVMLACSTSRGKVKTKMTWGKRKRKGGRLN